MFMFDSDNFCRFVASRAPLHPEMKHRHSPMLCGLMFMPHMLQQQTVQRQSSRHQGNDCLRESDTAKRAKPNEWQSYLTYESESDTNPEHL